MIRVLHVVRNMNRGGAETFIMNLFRNIDRSKIMFDFLVQSEKRGDFEDEIISLGGRVHRIKYVTDVGHFSYIKVLNKFFSEHKEYKIVHSHMNSMSGLILKAAKEQGVPNRISHSHNTRSSGNMVKRAYNWIVARYIKSAATQYFSCSKEAGRWLFRNVNEDKIKIIYNGIDIEIFKYDQQLRDDTRKTLKLDEKLVIGHVGSFTKQKNHKLILKIFNELHKKNTSAYLILVGDGPLKSKSEQLAREYNIENSVFFLGVRKDVNALMNAFDIFLFPSLYEGLPVTLIEAQACGLTCVISDTITKEIEIVKDQIIRVDGFRYVEPWIQAILQNKKKKEDLN